MRILGLTSLKEKYDVIIIGAGVAGLTCGCYLAKNGLSVLIIEYHSIPGGFCTSFKRGEFVFDIGVHYFGNVSKNGVIGRILRDLNLESELELVRVNPTDVIIMPECTIKFFNNLKETISSFQDSFPNEHESISNFLNFLSTDNFLLLYKTFRRKTFREILDIYFKDEKLKSVFSVMLGNIGLPSNKVTALTASVMYRDYIFKGGNYPKGGMQKFPDLLAKRFVEYGGDLLLNKSVTKIQLKHDLAEGIIIDDNNFVASDYIVSNGSARQTFCNLIGEDKLPIELKNKLKIMIPSPSAFIVYFSLNGSLKNGNYYSNTWYCPDYNIDKVYEDCFRGKFNPNFLFVALPSLHDESVCPPNFEVGHLITLAPCLSEEYWSKNQDNITQLMIRNAEKIIPGFSRMLHKYYPATPTTIINYTKADRGSIYGWASLLNQTGDAMTSTTFIPNLFLAGHWSTLETGQGGITMVALSGRNVAKKIINNISETAKIYD